MSVVEIPSDAFRLLQYAEFAYICTASENGQPHITPVFFLFIEQQRAIYFTTAQNSVKVRNILRNPRVALTMDVRDPVNPFNNRGLLVEGRARVVTSDYLLDKTSTTMRMQLEKKYPILKEATHDRQESSRAHLLGQFSEVLVEVRISKIVYWGGGPRFTTVKLT